MTSVASSFVGVVESRLEQHGSDARGGGRDDLQCMADVLPLVAAQLVVVSRIVRRHVHVEARRAVWLLRTT